MWRYNRVKKLCYVTSNILHQLHVGLHVAFRVISIIPTTFCNYLEMKLPKSNNFTFLVTDKVHSSKKQIVNCDQQNL